MEDLQILRPTFLPAVPRVLNRIFDTVMDTVRKGSALKKGVFWGLWYWKRFCLQHGGQSALADRMVFDALNSKTGGRIKQFIVGGAAMDPWIHEFMQYATGVPMRVGYGLSEIGSGNIVNPCDVNTSRPGTVGGPMPNTQVRLEPLADYDDPLCGEIVTGGQMCCSGYLFDEEQSKAIFVDEARTWVRTGDIGKWDGCGYLQIVDRIRSVFKLSQGEYVAAELLTLTYELAPLVQQIFVYGDSTRDSLVAIVVPAREKVAALFGKPQLSDAEFEAYCKDAKVAAAIKAELDRLATERKLPGYERIRKVACESEEWTTANDLMTPTFKLRRKKLSDKYRALIDKLYGD
jgi:long-chain acyl-CoA synthetase